MLRAVKRTLQIFRIGLYSDIMMKNKLIIGFSSITVLTLLILISFFVGWEVKKTTEQKTQTLLKSFELLEKTALKDSTFCYRYVEGEKILNEILDINKDMGVVYRKRAFWRSSAIEMNCKELEGGKALVSKRVVEDLQRERDLDPQIVKESVDLSYVIALLLLERQLRENTPKIDNRELFLMVDNEIRRITLLKSSCDTLQGMTLILSSVFNQIAIQYYVLNVDSPSLVNIPLYEELAAQAESKQCLQGDTDIYVSEFIYSEIVRFIRSQFEIQNGVFDFCSAERDISGRGRNSYVLKKCVELTIDPSEAGKCILRSFVQAGCYPSIWHDIVRMRLGNSMNGLRDGDCREGIKQEELVYGMKLLFNKNDYIYFKIQYMKEHPGSNLIESQ